MARSKGVSHIEISELIEVIKNQTGRLVSSDVLTDLIQSLPMDVNVTDTAVEINDMSASGTESGDEVDDISKPAIDAARKELK